MQDFIINSLIHTIMKTVEFILPVYYASTFINGDFSGLNEDEERHINNFLTSNTEKYGYFYCLEADVDNAYFARNNELTGMRHLGGDVCKYTFSIE